MMEVIFIHNADAGDDDQPTPGQLIALMEKAGHRVRHDSIQSESWASSLVQSADLVAVAGGDGTVGEVARRMVGRQTPIAVIPAGTANNIAKSLGIAEWHAARLIASWTAGVSTTFDAGVAEGPWGKRHFIEGAGIGLFTQAMPWINRHQKVHGPQSGGERVKDALQQLREHLHDTIALHLNATLDGQDISGRFIMFEAMNTRYVGPNMFLAPDVAHGEGLLHVVGITEERRDALDACLAHWTLGMTWPVDLGVHTGRRLEIEWSGFPLHLDDAVWPQANDTPPTSPAPVVFTIERAALQFLVPDAGQQDRTAG